MSNYYNQDVIWIIGASSGIGRALAVQLAHEGARLCLSARRKEELDALNAELGNEHIVYPLDVTDDHAVQMAASTLARSHGRIDRVIFMAGHYMPMDLANIEMDEVHAIIATNLTGALHVVQAVYPILKKQPSGQLVLTASVAGYRGLPHSQPYAATKAALINLAQSLRSEWPEHIDVKVINPGFVKTPMTAKNRFHMPMMITPEDAARAIAAELKSAHFEIHFPKLFTFFMKLVQRLPDYVYFKLARKM